ncbi:MAG: hypothetical protein ACK46A_01170 [Akkermansiaceae bacterium]
MKSSKQRHQVSTPKTDVEAAWERFENRLKHMTREEKLQTFVNAGILTPKGNTRKPYRGLFVNAKS